MWHLPHLFFLFCFYFTPLLFFMFNFRASNTQTRRNKQHKQEYEISTYNFNKSFCWLSFLELILLVDNFGMLHRAPPSTPMAVPRRELALLATRAGFCAQDPQQHHHTPLPPMASPAMPWSPPCTQSTVRRRRAYLNSPRAHFSPHRTPASRTHSTPFVHR